MTSRPNILWYCSDQQRFDTIAALGNPHIHTPNLDRFAAESAAFTHAYCQSPICTPSRASFLTGMYPSAVGVNANGYERFPAHHAERLLPRRLRDNGYDCGLIGKLHLASAMNRREERVDDGYSYFQYCHDHKFGEPGNSYVEWLEAQGIEPDSILQRREFTSAASYRQAGTKPGFGGLSVPTPENDNVPPHLHQTHWCTEKAIEFMGRERDSDTPWLLSVNPFDPHSPFDAPWEYWRRYDAESLPGAYFQASDLQRQRQLEAVDIDFQTRAHHPDSLRHKEVQASYYAMIEFVDHEFGRLLDWLDATGLRENTIVIFMSDHGEALCDHGLLLKGCRFYEGLTRVPLMISWPGKIMPQRSDALVELQDIAPTLYELLGMDVPAWTQGQSLADGLRSGMGDHRDFVRCEYFGAIYYPDQTHATMYRDRRWKLTIYHQKDACELYDLENDPWEHHDLSQAPDYADVLQDLIRRSFDAAIYATPAQTDRFGPF